MRNIMGSWPFVFGFMGFMFIWAGLNIFWLANHGWDPYPFILLNLLLSTLAGLQGAILLIAAKRQDEISAALAQHDFETNTATKAETALIKKINENQTLILKRILTMIVNKK